jgi:murein DD-endopeptidase MepM/ murein hydrolase activator NlpD
MIRPEPRPARRAEPIEPLAPAPATISPVVAAGAARRRADASWRERGKRAQRAFARAVRGLLTAVVVALAAYGAWELGSRVAGVDRPAVEARAPRPQAEPLPSGIAPRSSAARPARGQPSAPSPAADELRSPAPADPEGAAAANAVPEPERGWLPMPVLGADPEDLRDDFHDARGGAHRGTGSHDAIDILAPRHTPVVAVDDGTIAKLFVSERGGLTIYHFDPTETYCYYYAHLGSYAPDLQEGQRVARGQVIGYVGTSGNAPEDTPHLHFSVNRLGAEKRWWESTPINPFPLLSSLGSKTVGDGAR